MKFGGKGIMVWGYISTESVGQLAEVEGRMNTVQSVDILKNCLLLCLEESEISFKNMIFQKSNNLKHISKEPRSGLENSNIHVLDWPLQSPNANHIDHLWEHIK